MQTIEAPAPGLYKNVAYETYAGWKAVNSSFLNRMRKSPAHARQELENPSESTAAKDFGHLAHTRVLEPELFSLWYVRCPDFATGLCDDKGKPYANPKATNKYKELIAAFQAEHAGKQLLDGDTWDRVEAIAEAVYRHPAAAVLLESATAREVSGIWLDEQTGLTCKGRFDVIQVDPFEVVVDLKTTLDASPDAFFRDIQTYGYHRQGAHYVNGARALEFAVRYYVVIAVEKEPPYAVGVYRLDPESLELGKMQVEQLLSQAKVCLETGEWPAYSGEIRDTYLPEWVRAKLTESEKSELKRRTAGYASDGFVME